jgi:hypothetical protein
MTDQLMESRAVPSVAAAGVVAREAAMVRGQMMMAREFPRDFQRAWELAMQSCERPAFADGALYAFPRGGKTVSGPSVKLARELARQWANLAFELAELPDEDPKQVHLRATARDLETNVSVAREDRFLRAIQRRGQQATSWVEPDERDLRELKNRRGAILIRNCLLELMPSDLVDAAVDACRATTARAAEGELGRAKAKTIKALIQTFAQLGVTENQLETYLGGPVADISPEQLADLRATYTAIEEGVKTAASIFPPTGGAKSSAITEDLQRKIAERTRNRHASQTTTSEPKTEPVADRQPGEDDQ